jgi:hypothetical protein
MDHLVRCLFGVALALVLLGIVCTAQGEALVPCNILPCICGGCDCNTGGSCTGYLCLRCCICTFEPADGKYYCECRF